LDQLLQLTAGIFYLLNKILFSSSERSLNQNNKANVKKWKIAAWAVYLIGLPAWVIIFIKEHNWIAAALLA